MHDPTAGVGSRVGRVSISSGLALVLALVAVPRADAQTATGTVPAPAAPAAAAQPETAPASATSTAADPGAYDFYCPVCHTPLRWDQDTCPNCKTELEPLKPRTVKGQGRAGREEVPAEAGEASPFGEGEPSPGRVAEGPDVTGYGARPRPLIKDAWPQIQPPTRSRFLLGSYGRVGVLTDEGLRGAENHAITDFAPRLTKGPYEELHFYYKDLVAELPVMVKTTIAFQEQLFHLDGQFDAQIAVREAYAQIEPSDDLAFWMGARMYRGDDVYLFDVWPLDDQNTVGAGGAVRVGEHHQVQAHVGFNRIVDENFFQFQTIELPKQDAVGVREAVFLNRYRLTGSLTYALTFGGLLLKAHGEVSYLPPDRRRLTGGALERLPADHGFRVGGELGYIFGPQSFARLFLTYGRGLSAYDELQVPFGFDTGLRVTDAWFFRVALGGALDSSFAGVHWGLYWQRFRDADGVPDRDDTDQLAVAVRPLLYLGRYLRVGAELSFQARTSDGIFQATGQKESAFNTEVYGLVGVAAGKGPYARPALYLFYGASFLNEGARLELERQLADRPAARTARFGLLAEWWF